MNKLFIDLYNIYCIYKMNKNTFEQERLDDFLEILPINLDSETKKAIDEYIWILMNTISLFEWQEWISEEDLQKITKNLVDSFRFCVWLLIKRD